MFTNINSVLIAMIEHSEQDKIHYNKNQTRLGSSSQGRIQPGAQGHAPPPLPPPAVTSSMGIYILFPKLLITF